MPRKPKEGQGIFIVLDLILEFNRKVRKERYLVRDMEEALGIPRHYGFYKSKGYLPRGMNAKFVIGVLTNYNYIEREASKKKNKPNSTYKNNQNLIPQDLTLKKEQAMFILYNLKKNTLTYNLNQAFLKKVESRIKRDELDSFFLDLVNHFLSLGEGLSSDILAGTDHLKSDIDQEIVVIDETPHRIKGELKAFQTTLMDIKVEHPNIKITLDLTIIGDSEDSLNVCLIRTSNVNEKVSIINLENKSKSVELHRIISWYKIPNGVYKIAFFFKKPQVREVYIEGHFRLSCLACHFNDTF